MAGVPTGPGASDSPKGIWLNDGVKRVDWAYPAVPLRPPLITRSFPLGKVMNCPMVRPSSMSSSCTYTGAEPSCGLGVIRWQSLEAGYTRTTAPGISGSEVCTLATSSHRTRRNELRRKNWIGNNGTYWSKCWTEWKAFLRALIKCEHKRWDLRFEPEIEMFAE